ncbi:MAG: glycerol-3-phosphate dehydrogenase/oxidase [Vicinamibacterales bacterium]
MRRDLRTLAGREFDLLVVGAGIYGATIASEAAHRGLTVALVDRGDFGSGTSANSLKTVHGGLRSLQRANVSEMRRFIRERRALLRVAPHLVAPLRFVIPTRPGSVRSKLAMRVALALNDAIGRDRNAGLDPARRLPPSAVLDRAEMLRLLPGVDAAAVSGGAAWYDAQLYNADRLLLAFVAAAAAAGASVANYVSATAILRRGDRVEGVAARDELTGAPFEIRARVTLNAAGGWTPGLLSAVGPTVASRLGLRLSRAFNLVTRLAAPPCALGNTAGGQFLFCVPWRGIAMFGTMHDAHAGDADRVTVDRADVDRFVGLVNHAFPFAALTAADVTLVHRGLLPMVDGAGAEVRLVKDSLIRDHRADGIHGLLTVVGVRYTTARETAERAVDSVADMLGRRIAPSRSAVTPLPGGAIDDVARFERIVRGSSAGLRPSLIDRLLRSYGTLTETLAARMRADEALAAPVGHMCDITTAEVNHAVRHEMALRLDDVVFRRTEAGSAGCPGEDALRTIAALMAADLGWDARRVDEEIRRVGDRYRIPE